jgi:hypothetical protein
MTIDNQFLNELRGKDDIPDIIKLPSKVYKLQKKLSELKQRESEMKLKRVKTLPIINIPRNSVKNIFRQTKRKEYKIFDSLPSLKNTPQCPEGFVWSIRSGKCVKAKKLKMNKKIVQDPEFASLFAKLRKT